MQILSFDTSSPDIQIALSRDGQIVLAESYSCARSGRQESASRLLPFIDAALKNASISKKSLDLIAVGAGPGSFTGVRVALVTARTLAQALGLGLLAFSNLELLAYASTRPCAVVFSAGGGKYYGAAYGLSMQGAEQGSLLEPFCGDKEEVETRLKHLNNWVLPADIDKGFFSEKKVLSFPADLNYAVQAAKLAYERLTENPAQKWERESLAKAYPWDNVLPLYLRSPSVTIKAKNGNPDKTAAS